MFIDMQTAYEKLTAEETGKLFGTDASQGLTDSEAKLRLERDGPNALAVKKGKSPVIKLLSQFNDPLIYILLAATAVSLAAQGVYRLYHYRRGCYTQRNCRLPPGIQGREGPERAQEDRRARTPW
jgi:magnesium-transporting ATPase (P-type)